MSKKQLEQIRHIVYMRCGGFCEKCGQRLPESWALHHRKLRSRGGKDCPTNLLALHHSCHNLATNSVHFNPADSLERGFMVASWDTPEKCPITLPSGDIVTLTDNGEYVYQERGKYGW